MKIRIRAHDVKVTKALRAHVELRLGFALSRFGEQIGEVAVHFSKAEDSRDSDDNLCRITVDVRRCVKVQETAANAFAAVDRAALRAARSVAHAIDQEREHHADTSGLWTVTLPQATAAAPLRAARKAHAERPLLLKRKYSSAPPRKLQSPQGA